MEISRDSIAEWLKQLQDSICLALEDVDGSAKFKEDNWKRDAGGGGRTRVLQDGKVIEKGGVNFSAVSGDTPAFLLNESQHSLSASNNPSQFFATGVSIVIHPISPMVPIIHMNIRYFETSEGVRWLGGGIDLTPIYVNDEDASYFHKELKRICDKHNSHYYKKFKTWADDYFYIIHRNETRGIGGIFFDRLNEDSEMNFERNLSFWKDVGEAFSPIYTELILRNKNKSFNERHKQWQLLRRGRYVEFNLVYDKGTKFGLETNGRTESILMSLPKFASWEYNFQVKSNSDEDHTLQKLKKGIHWI